MPKFHDRCPICNSELKVDVLLRNETWFGKKIHIKKYVCSKDSFIQITDLYKSVLFESVSFDKGLSLNINYVNHNSIIYLDGSNKIELKNRIVDLDYPLLEKARQKVKTLALFS